jgi:hypothetical protein
MDTMISCVEVTYEVIDRSCEGAYYVGHGTTAEPNLIDASA